MASSETILTASDRRVVLAALVAAMAVLGGSLLRSDPSLELPWRGDAPRAEVLALNRATPPELERVSGIGPTLAERIVRDRLKHGPFRRVADVTRVPGVGPETRAALREAGARACGVGGCRFSTAPAAER